MHINIIKAYSFNSCFTDIFDHINILGPCKDNPCRGPNTLCLPLSELKHRCICESGYLPVNNSSEFHGCSLASDADLKVSLEMEQKDKTNINTNILYVTQKCGPNAGLVGKACYCFANSFELTRGDANKPEIGCKSKEFVTYSRQVHNLFFSDPCESDPCKGQNTICISTSSSEFKCVCEENYCPVNKNSRLNGCQMEGKSITMTPKKKCGPNSNLLVSGTCLCYQNYFEEAKGDAETEKGCKSKGEILV